MASINGVMLKNIRTYTGIEGTAYQGSIYLGSKKIGFWSEDGDGGPAWIEMDKGFSERKFEALIANTYPEKAIKGEYSDGRSYKIPYDSEMFFNDLMGLTDDEKQYKKFQESGCCLMIITDGFHVTNLGLPPVYSDMSDERIKEILSAKIKKAEENFYTDRETEINIYRSFDDFNIGESFTLDQIRA